MRRRDILRKFGALAAVGGFGALAGCSGGSDESETDAEESASLDVDEFDYREGDDGELVVTVSVANAGDAEGTGRLYVTVTTVETTSETEDGEEDDTNKVASRESLEVTVPAGETEDLEIPFEFTYDQFVRDGSIDIDLRT